MRYQISSAVLIAASITHVLGIYDSRGNEYSNPIDAITYTNWGQPSTYGRVVEMANGDCKQENVSYSGGMSPLDGEISWHFRGPMHLKQFAFYIPGTGSSKRNTKPSIHQRRHAHGDKHLQPRSVGTWVTATINGVVQSWQNQYGGMPVTTALTSTAAIMTPYSAPQASSSSTSSPQPAASVINPGSGNWGRQAYYHAESSQGDGLVFLNNHGGAGSGVFDYRFGMSLSYASIDSATAASSPQILADTLLSDIVEVSIWSDKQCQGDDCGYYRPGSVAYHGFDGLTKMFFIEFDMPATGKREQAASDMPAIWMLNANIPRTQQYGSCSCWPGCGENDVFEVLDNGFTMAKTTAYSAKSGGDDGYFERPTNKTMKLGVIFDGTASESQVFILPNDTDFTPSVSDAYVKGFSKACSESDAAPVFADKVFDLAIGHGS